METEFSGPYGSTVITYITILLCLFISLSVCVCLCVTCLFHFTMGLYLIQIRKWVGLDYRRQGGYVLHDVLHTFSALAAHQTENPV